MCKWLGQIILSPSLPSGWNPNSRQLLWSVLCYFQHVLVYLDKCSNSIYEACGCGCLPERELFRVDPHVPNPRARRAQGHWSRGVFSKPLKFTGAQLENTRLPFVILGEFALYFKTILMRLWFCFFFFFFINLAALLTWKQKMKLFLDNVHRADETHPRTKVLFSLWNVLWKMSVFFWTAVFFHAPWQVFPDHRGAGGDRTRGREEAKSGHQKPKNWHKIVWAWAPWTEMQLPFLPPRHCLVCVLWFRENSQGSACASATFLLTFLSIFFSLSNVHVVVAVHQALCHWAPNFNS